MLKRFSITCLVLSALVAGCTTARPGPHWSRPGMQESSPMMLQADQDDCRMRAERKIEAMKGDPGHPDEKRSEIFRCMEEKGWVWQDESAVTAPARGGYHY